MLRLCILKIVVVPILAGLTSAFHSVSTERHRTLTLTPLRTSSVGDLQDNQRAVVLDAAPSAPSIVEKCYAAWNRRDASAAAACFAEEFVYDEGQYLGSVTKKSELRRRFELGIRALPPKSVVVVDNIAVCPTTGNIGTRWHAEREDRTTVPFTKGCSFYTTDSDGGLIKTGFKVSEMVIKPSKTVSNSLVAFASKMMGTADRTSINVETGPSSTEASSSIIEEYFEAWNSRDTEAALACFVDDCVYEVEDSVFVDTFRGKTGLREHLVNNAAVLPSSCQIVLDDLAIDSLRGTFGVKWHLEVSGAGIPNLRGCSMYTMDCEVGLLKSGFDVTEAPVKLPGVAQNLISLPSKLGLFS